MACVRFRWMASGRNDFALAAGFIAGLASLHSAVGPAVAQSADRPNAPVVALDPITVTARQVEEPLREVPFGISVVTQDEIAAGGIRETRDMHRAIASFNYTDSGLPEANLLNMRGIGSSSTFLSPSVTYYVDGVPIPQRVFDQQHGTQSQISIQFQVSALLNRTHRWYPSYTGHNMRADRATALLTARSKFTDLMIVADRVRERISVIQGKTYRSVQFEFTENTPESI